MNPQITAILLGVKDLDRAKQFYSEGLGGPIEKDYPGFVSSISAATRRRWRSTPGKHLPRTRAWLRTAADSAVSP
jgi:catechol 2,3-dioxygenase-like lactoylglutathione lyase family enzyme